MTYLHDLHHGQLVTLLRSSALMQIDGFSRENDEEWHATVHFVCDPLKTTVSYPISLLSPVLTPEKEPYHASVH